MTGLAIRGDLTPVETDRLAELERVVDQGRQTFVQVGEALMEIRDARLYRTSHGTFDDYCRERWGMSRVHAHRMVEAATVASVLPTGNTLASERQARELAPLLNQPDQLREAWDEASSNGTPTATTVRQAVERRVLTIPVSDEQLVREQRETLIQSLDRAVRAMELSAGTAAAEAQRLLAGGDAGPFTPERFEKVAAYADAFAGALREAGVE